MRSYCTLSALLPNGQHSIQIGDHEQICPQIDDNNFSLENLAGKRYQLGRSHFERLAAKNNGTAKFLVDRINVTSFIGKQDSRKRVCYRIERLRVTGRSHENSFPNSLLLLALGHPFSHFVQGWLFHNKS